MVQQFSDDDGKAGEAGLHVRTRPARSDDHRHRHAALPARASWRRHCLGCAARLARHESLSPQGKSSFTSCAGRARRSNTTRRRSREHRRLRPARSTPQQAVCNVLREQDFPAPRLAIVGPFTSHADSFAAWRRICRKALGHAVEPQTSLQYP